MFGDLKGLAGSMALQSNLIEDVVAALERGGWEPGTRLGHHLETCFGCGPANSAGLGLEVLVGDEDGVVVADYTFKERHMGAPGVAHGGATAALLDDLFGFVLVRSFVLGVTRELSVSYLRPVRIGVPCEVTACLERRDDRDLHMSATLDQTGERCVTATAVFRVVDPAHLADPMARFDTTKREEA